MDKCAYCGIEIHRSSAHSERWADKNDKTRCEFAIGVNKDHDPLAKFKVTYSPGFYGEPEGITHLFASDAETASKYAMEGIGFRHNKPVIPKKIISSEIVG